MLINFFDRTVDVKELTLGTVVFCPAYWRTKDEPRDVFPVYILGMFKNINGEFELEVGSGPDDKFRRLPSGLFFDYM